MVEKYAVLCPACRVAMVWVDTDEEGFNRHSCPSCGGVVELSPGPSDRQPKWSVSSRIVGDFFAHSPVHALSMVESDRDSVSDRSSRADAPWNRRI
jgi:hypothetical protein